MLIRNLNHINAFLQIVDSGSIASASRRLKKSQTSVSSSVCNLEIELGVDLLKRDGHKAVPTDEARKLIPHMNNLLNSAEVLMAAVDSITTERPKLNIYLDNTIPSAFCDSIDGLVVAESFDTVRVFRGSPTDGLNMLKKGEINLAVTIHEEETSEQYSKCVLGYGRTYVVTSSSHPLAKEPSNHTNDLKNYRLIALNSRECVPGHFQPASNDVCYVESYEDMLRLIKKGVGWGVMPYYYASRHLESGDLKKLNEEYEKDGVLTKIYCYFSASLKSHRAFDEFLNNARQAICTLEI